MQLSISNFIKNKLKRQTVTQAKHWEYLPVAIYQEAKVVTAANYKELHAANNHVNLE